MSSHGGSNTLINILNRTIQDLEKAGIDSARNQAQLILAHVLDLKAVDLYLHKDLELDGSRVNEIEDLKGKRISGVPLQYLTGKTDFYGYELFAEEGVFIGRPETEILVERIIALAKENFSRPVRILEIGCGCGNIAVALTKNLADCRIICTDLNRKALELAGKNAGFHGVESRISRVCADIWPIAGDNVPEESKFDIIVSNPPYVTREEMKFLPREVKAEPPSALDGGTDGLDFYRKIISACGLYLKEPGWIAFEFGDFQRPEMEVLLRESGKFRGIDFFADLNRTVRFVIAGFHHG